MNTIDLTRNIQAAADVPCTDIPEAERIGLIAACGRLRDALETPFETTVRIIFSVSCPSILRAHNPSTDCLCSKAFRIDRRQIRHRRESFRCRSYLW